MRRGQLVRTPRPAPPYAHVSAKRFVYHIRGDFRGSVFVRWFRLYLAEPGYTQLGLAVENARFNCSMTYSSDRGRQTTTRMALVRKTCRTF